MQLKDNVVIVTGGGRGLGREFALTLAEAGAVVAVIARSEEQLVETVELIEQTGGRAIAIPLDVTDQLAVESAVAKVSHQLGSIDILVNNAGVYQAAGRVWEANPDAWWRELEINLQGPFLCMRAVLPGMVARGKGRVINVASSGGIFGWTYSSAYSASKTALIRLSEIAALETKQYGVSVFSIDPGTVHTSMVNSILTSKEVYERAPHIQEGFQRMMDADQMVSPENASRLVLKLAAGEADALSGSYISIGDDLAGLLSRAEEIISNQRHTLRIRI
jgi:NAD(P)-dependent dehydrogenase (short-subunit alcohol dehydrogenase family)